jgi:hypothetical protein
MKSRHWLKRERVERYLTESGGGLGGMAWELDISGALMSRMMLPPGAIRRLPISPRTRRKMLEVIPAAEEFWIVEDGTAAPRCPHCGGNLDGPGAAAGGAA